MEPYGITLFCDDIRFEQLGKITLVGLYGPELQFYSELPANLLRLCFFVQIRTEAVADQVTDINIYLPGEESQPAYTFKAPSNPSNSLSDFKDMPPDVQPLLGINLPITISPLPIMQEGYIKVRAICGSKVLKIGALKITKKPQETTSSNAPEPPSSQSPPAVPAS